MRLEPREVYNILINSGVKYLHHSNTVATACSFFKTGGLLSRGGIEKYQLVQTPQYTDKIDKIFNIWNDIFFDSVDIHYRTRNKKAYNKYGPVLFKFKLELLLAENLPEVWITKQNPSKWYSDQDIMDRYFNNVDELKMDYTCGDFDKMITLRCTDEILEFNEYLEEIILDDPQLYINNVYVYDHALKELKGSANGVFDLAKLKKRSCFNCNCNLSYKSMGNNELSRLFIL